MYMDFGKYIAIGERGYTMERYINCKFGVSAANDRLPKRLTDVPQDPKNPNTRVPLETMKKTYYAARGWGKNGIPTEATLRRLKGELLWKCLTNWKYYGAAPFRAC